MDTIRFFKAIITFNYFAYMSELSIKFNVLNFRQIEFNEHDEEIDQGWPAQVLLINYLNYTIIAYMYIIIYIIFSTYLYIERLGIHLLYISEA